MAFRRALLASAAVLVGFDDGDRGRVRCSRWPVQIRREYVGFSRRKTLRGGPDSHEVPVSVASRPKIEQHTYANGLVLFGRDHAERAVGGVHVALAGGCGLRERRRPGSQTVARPRWRPSGLRAGRGRVTVASC